MTINPVTVVDIAKPVTQGDDYQVTANLTANGTAIDLTASGDATVVCKIYDQRDLENALLTVGTAGGEITGLTSAGVLTLTLTDAQTDLLHAKRDPTRFVPHIADFFVTSAAGGSAETTADPWRMGVRRRLSA